MTGGGIPNFASETIWTGDNLKIMRGMNSDCIDLIYLDPPFNSNRVYEAPIGSKAAGAAFRDMWTPSDLDEREHQYLKAKSLATYTVIEAVKQTHGKSMMSYLTFMANRLLEMHRVLKETGTIYLHCDTTAGHYLKVLMDSIFNPGNFRNELVWHYGKMSNSSKNFPANHDTIFRYTKSDKFVFNPIKGGESEYKTRFSRFLTGNKVLYGRVKHLRDKLISMRCRKVSRELGRDLEDSDVLYDFDKEFKIQSDVIYVPTIKGNSAERTGYPTQKPLALLKKIILASSNEGDLVFDPFCGCATTLVAASRLRRKWVGCDLSQLTVKLVNDRIREEEPLFEASNPDKLPVRTDI